MGEQVSKQNKQSSQFKMFSNCSECLFFVVISLVCTVLLYKCFDLCGLLDRFVDKLEREEAEREEIAKFLSEEKARILAALESVRQRREQGERNRSRAETIKLQIAQSKEENNRLKARIVELDEKIFQKELERRKKHDERMNRRGNIRVFCRVRPNKGNEEDIVRVNSKRSSVSLVANNKNSKQMTTSDFEFDKVYAPSASQQEVFQDIELLVQSALDGHRVCIFAYGQTGSGKSHTMEGPPQIKQDSSFYRDNPHRGIIPRTVGKIFDHMPQLAQMGWTYTLKCSFAEVYQENIYDLLSTKVDKKELQIFNDEMKDLTVCQVNSVEQVDALMIKAKKQRKVGSTNMNKQSSRSHFIFQMVIEGTNANGSKCCGRLNLVDLAGSENLEAAKDEQQRKEGAKIRESLSALSTVLTQLRQDPKASAGFRNSKLTRLLKTDLSAGSKILMFVNIAPEASSLMETKCSLNFAKSVNSVKLTPAKGKKMKSQK